MVLALVGGATLNGATLGRAEVGRPIAGIAAVIDATAPLEDIFNGQFCGGSLVAPDRVLTAAHCVAEKSPRGIEVVIGADNLCRGRAIDGKRVGVRSITLHPGYDAASRRFDLAILGLKEPITDAVRAVVHPPRHDGGHLTALGWGRASDDGAPGCRLTRVHLELLDPERCQEAIGGAFDAGSMMCAVPRVAGQDTCIGDSGGPILIGSDVADASVVGVVSWGFGCGAQAPGVYAEADRWRGPIEGVSDRVDAK